MSAIVFAAVIAAAILHAAWNAVVKGGTDKTLAMTALIVGHVPLALAVLVFVPLPAMSSLPYLVAGVILHFGYQLLLLKSYHAGDLTQVYPIARGTAPLLVAGISVTILGVELSRLELLAVLIIGFSIISLSLVRAHDGSRNGRAAILAFGTGCFIAGYSLVDGLGARQAGTALGFFATLAVFNSAAMALYIRMTKPGTLRQLHRKGLKVMIVGGTASFAAYSMVVWAFTQAPIALVTALRETSIVFALLIGVFVLKERLDLLKLVSIVTTMIGVVLLRISR